MAGIDGLLVGVLDARGKAYGDYYEKANFIQGVKFLMHRAPNWDMLEPDTRESLEMIAHKISRVLYGDPELKDNFVDIAGYAMLIAERLGGEG